MRCETILLADDAVERREVIEDLLTTLGYRVVACHSVEMCRRLLGARISPFTGVVGNAWLEEQPLLPILERYCEVEAVMLAPICLWSLDGVEDLAAHSAFLTLYGGIVFPLPLDLDLFRQVVRLIASYGEPQREA